MAALLEIEDGNPWWLSHDIWVVPGDDPNGSPGQPVAGRPAYLWARVHNKGDSAAAGAVVNYYWSNPATGVLRSNSTMIGSSFVDLEAGETKEVLCIIPWIPVIVNDGHECVVAEVILPSDPLPAPLPDPFNPPEYRQVAQTNLSVLEIRSLMMQVLPIQVAAAVRKAQRFRVAVEVGGSLDERLLNQIGMPKHQPSKSPEVDVGLSREPDCGEGASERLTKELTFKLGPGVATAVYLHVTPARMEPNTYTVVHVTSRGDREIEGGITYLVVNREGD